jgi:hypothetical protein
VEEKASYRRSKSVGIAEDNRLEVPGMTIPTQEVRYVRGAAEAPAATEATEAPVNCAAGDAAVVLASLRNPERFGDPRTFGDPRRVDFVSDARGNLGPRPPRFVI